MPTQNLQHKTLHWIGIKRVFKCDHLLQDTTQRPHVTLLVLGLFLADFGWEILRCADGGLRAVLGVLQHACDAEVAHLDLALAIQEYVLCLQVPVQYLPVMDVLDCQCNLHEPVQNLVLREASSDLFLLRDHLKHVSPVRVVHYNAQTPLVHEWLALCDYLRVSHCFQHVNFIQCFLLLFSIHLTYIYYFHYLQLLVLDWLD